MHVQDARKRAFRSPTPGAGGAGMPMVKVVGFVLRGAVNSP
jgi:hypothetical protein